MIENLFFYIANFSVLLPLVFFLLYIRKTKHQPPLWVIFFYSLFVLSTLCIYFFLPSYINGHFDAVIYLVEFILFSLFLFYTITKKKLKQIILLGIIAFIVFWVIHLFSDNITQFDPILVGVKSIILLFLSFLFFYEKLSDAGAKQYVYDDYRFWGVLGIIFYIGGSFLIYIFYARFYNEVKQFELFLSIIYTIKNLLFAVCVFKFIFNRQGNPKKNLTAQMFD